ncbi:hypothetical protein L6270_01070, partial [Candidatus Parcubacteria bacterium]|nr:hypothetical protein [Patescibacteria group bacterium]MBU4309737.1 hypothetical protein [Patescibacteria group bacterium]MCG2696614.1 hypothetical protein [Candidatus Parcubacteria bacterium]
MTTATSKIMSLPEQVVKWAMITLAILVISGIVCIGFTRFPFFVVFSWVAFLFVVPYIWEIYGKDAIVLDFWSSIVKFGLKFIGSLFIFLLLRGYVAHVVKFGMMTSQTIGAHFGKAGWLEMNRSEVLFEATFLLLIGYTVLVFVYKSGESEKKNWPRNVVVGMLLTCLMAQTFMFMSGDGVGVAEAAIQPVQADNVIPKIKSSGVVGGGAKIAFAFLFGESVPSMPQMTGVRKSKTPQIIFSHTYTDADIGPDGKVIVLDYAKTLLMPGDVLNINTIMPRGGGS